MTYAGKTGRNSVLGSAIAILLLAAAVVVIVVYVALNPDILKSLIYLALAVVAAGIAIAVIVYIAAAILAVPYYAAKGEEYQTDSAYNLDDIKSVKETDSEKKDR
ncbi:MAG: hypothetical protein LBJ20_04445 [Candidatus Methanoplasma sp.]|jgi:multisubunit Na+/H+ antiporter MnhC subunit|nr:hypothetical protein [Candidatus Methanoplasma sp.]